MQATARVVAAPVSHSVRAIAIAWGVGGIVFGLVVMAVVPVWDGIALEVPDSAVDARLLGVLLWTAVCLVTSSRGLIEDGRAAIVLAIGPLIAVAALGGPAAAAFVAIFGTFELRELRREIPWYGVLANHGMAAIAWTTAALVLAGLRAVAGDARGPFADFVMLVVAACLGAGLCLLMVVTSVRSRTGRPLAEALVVPLRALVVLLLSETALAWLIAVAYVGIAWWSALLFIVVDTAAAGSLARHRADWHLRHHPLTALPNSLGLRDHTADLRKAAASSLGVFYVDLDWFKRINDDHGSDVGDDVLRVTGSRLATVCREHDFLAHLHGDEFLVLAAGIRDDADAAAFARRLVEAVEPPIEHAVGVLQVSATVGFRLVTDLDAIDAAIRYADREMQTTKDAKAAAARRTRRRT